MSFFAGAIAAFVTMRFALDMARDRRLKQRLIECPVCNGLSVDTTGEKIVHCAQPECGVLFQATGGWLF